MIKKFVKDMLTHGRAKDLLELLAGESAYTNENITCTNLPANENEMILMSHAIEHLTRISNNLGLTQRRPKASVTAHANNH